MLHRLVFMVAFVLVCGAAQAEPCDFGSPPGNFHDYPMHNFELEGVACKVVCPKEAEAGTPWIWRARFFSHEPQTDLALLESGFHVVYTDVSGLFGNDEAVARWDRLYALLTREHGFAPKPALEGMSRGGLIIYNWALANPEKVACIYADAPVLDIRSWPGGFGEGQGSPGDWQAAVQRHDVEDKDNPPILATPALADLKSLVDAGVPLMHVVGAADDVVPVAENSVVLEKRYREAGGRIHVISKEGVGHHPHSLEDPQPIVDFVRAYASGFGENYFELRDGLENAHRQFTKNGNGRVAFLGGSITEMTGWRQMVQEDLRGRFPETEFDFIDAGIASTDSSYHAFRLPTHVLHRGKVDLLFVESVVNELHNERSPEAQRRGIEGIIRAARKHNPAIDIVLVYFVDPSHEGVWKEGITPEAIAHQNAIAALPAYNVPSINLSGEIVDRIARGEFEWKDFGDAHPKPMGHVIYANRIARLMDAAWCDFEYNAPEGIVARAIPFAADPKSYSNGRFMDIRRAEVIGGWDYIDAWQPKDRAGKRKQFIDVPVLEASEPGAELVIPFEGTAIGILVTAGPDAGILEFSIDGKDYAPLDQFTRWSAGLHIPWVYMLDDELEPGSHRLKLRMSEEKNDDSTGHTSRIQQFLVN